jgi:tetratricopeptide (TPR) repeat protein
LAQAPGPADELRILRDIVRLDSKDEAAAARMRALSAAAASAATPSRASDDDDEPEISVSAGQQEPRRPAPTDAATTSRMPLEQFHQFVREQSLLRTRPPPTSPGPAAPAPRSTAPLAGTGRPAMSPSQVTQPNAEMAAAAAEEMALTSGTLKEELDEVDFFLQQKMFDEAQKLLKSLLSRYPHSKTVLAKQQEVASQAVVDDVVIDVDVDEVREVDSEPTARLDSQAMSVVTDEGPTDKMAPVAKPAAAVPPAPPGRVPPLPPRVPAPPPPAPALVMPSGRSLKAPATPGLPAGSQAAARGSVPILQGPPEKAATTSEASGAFRLGVSYRNRGQYAQAVSEFKKAVADPKRAARAALMLGLCYRDQNQLKEAIEAFRDGLQMPGGSEPDVCELHYQLGRTYEQLGEREHAAAAYHQAMKPAGRFKDADARLASLQGKSSRSLK